MSIRWEKVVVGQKYRIHTRIGQQKYPREHILTYLGAGLHGSAWNARPVAGTQEIRDEQIVGIWPADWSDAHRMNKIIRPQ